MKLFGLTGGIGMGKSSSEHVLREYGLPVIDTDALARQVVEPGQPGLEEVRSVFGDEILTPDGRLSREGLARKVFSDADARRQLEVLLHPRIRALWKKQVELWRSDSKSVGVVVIPLLFETGAEPEFDATICVACTRRTQQARLLARGWSPAEIDQRLAAQWNVERKMTLANHVVWTEGGLDLLRAQLARII